MAGRSSGMNQGTTVEGERPRLRQSSRSCWKASNDRGAKGGRNVMTVMGLEPTRKGQRSAFNEAVRADTRRTEPGISHPSASGPSETAAGGIGGTGSLRPQLFAAP